MSALIVTFRHPPRPPNLASRARVEEKGREHSRGYAALLLLWFVLGQIGHVGQPPRTRTVTASRSVIPWQGSRSVTGTQTVTGLRRVT